MPKRATKQTRKRVQVYLGDELGARVEEMANSMGITEGALSAVLIRIGFARMGDMLGPDDPLKEVSHQERHEVEVEDRPGFRPGGKPRAELEVVDPPPVSMDDWVPSTPWLR